MLEHDERFTYSIFITKIFSDKSFCYKYIMFLSIINVQKDQAYE